MGIWVRLEEISRSWALLNGSVVTVYSQQRDKLLCKLTRKRGGECGNKTKAGHLLGSVDKACIDSDLFTEASAVSCLV